MSLPTPFPRHRSAPRSGSRLATVCFCSLLVATLVPGCDAGDDLEERSTPQGAATAMSDAADGRAPRAAAPRPGTAWVILGTDTVVAEVAATPDEREQGLMFRDAVPDGTGMLFVFDREQVRSFWMQNTFVDLDIAFMDAGFRIVDIQTMEAETTDFYESAVPALYALEVRAGWFADRGVEVGDVAQVRFGG